jgi:hypothetical protein
MSGEASKSTKVATQEQQPEAPDALEQQLLAEAKTPQERALAFQLATTARQHSMLRRVALAVAETGWGKEISPVARQAVIRFCLEIGADPVRHVNVLGGNVYLTAAFWMELVAANPKFIRPETAFIHDDDRADQSERERRKAQRLIHGVPEDVKGAAVVTLFYQGRGPFLGVNWVGGGRKADPVGLQEPTKTAETRAYRRAAVKAEPAWFREHPRLQAAENVLAQGRELEQTAEQLPPFASQSIPSAAGEPVSAAAITVPVEAKDPYTGAPVMTNHSPTSACAKPGDHLISECAHAAQAARD